MRDDDIRSSCFASLDVLCAKFGPELPYKGALDEGFAFRGRRIPFINFQKGIYKAAAQSGPAALSVNTSYKSPYDDQETPDGFIYAYRAGDDRPARQPCAARRLSAPGADHLLRWHAARVVSARVARLHHQRRPDRSRRDAHAGTDGRPVRRARAVARRRPDRTTLPVPRRASASTRPASGRGCLPAYANQCAICRLKETRLLDAAHIVGDLEEKGLPVVSNGLSLCTIHHRAFDEDVVGISPDYEVRVASRLLDEETGRCDLLKKAHAMAINVLKRKIMNPIGAAGRAV